MSGIRRLLPSINALVAFEAVVRCGTFAKAAEDLGVTSPAVSRTIGRLECHLGIRLFQRTPRGAVLTNEGSKLFAGVSQGFGEIERTVSDLVDRRLSTRRPIVLSVSSGFATHWFMPRLARFQTCFPREEIHFRLINGPLEGPVEGIDIAMRFDPQAEASTCVYPLMRESLLPVCSELYQGARTEADNLLPAAARMISLSGSRFQWHQLFAPCFARGRGNEILLTDYSLVVQAALVGQGMAVGWFNVVSGLLASGALVPALPQVIATGRRCDLVLPKRPHSPVVTEICDWMVQEFQSDIARIRMLYPSVGRQLEETLFLPNQNQLRRTHDVHHGAYQGRENLSWL
ncbi:MAG: LysR family transcriptional regulator [Bosea sp.]|uniref:LysR family transcriptional regulator n=1 Tax=Bosea sp. (in: a-proteobacteria) TaxID=1871050 RepID=UPI0023877C3D|nr:LysR family transcriptional regulator [Bosea sp. (in: a-proteobacteria)]MCP4732674.1 LysR family transcriptional regulator [Bosea sp. (in: a-proteobacteria)]